MDYSHCQDRNITCVGHVLIIPPFLSFDNPCVVLFVVKEYSHEMGSTIQEV